MDGCAMSGSWAFILMVMVKGSKLQTSCVFEADGSGSRVKDAISWEVVRDAKVVARSPERRQWMGGMGQ